MEIEIKTWLADIIQAIEEIDDFLPDKRNYLEFQEDLKTKRAIERNIEIIGEAVSRILKTDSEFPIENARKIVDTRNRVIHGYDSVSDDNYLVNCCQRFAQTQIGGKQIAGKLTGSKLCHWVCPN